MEAAPLSSPVPIGDVRPAPCPSYLVCPSGGPGPAPPLPLPAQVRPVPEQTGRWLQGRSPPGIPCGCRVPPEPGAVSQGGWMGWHHGVGTVHPCG